jgi:catechol 2,3-dioxygenase-like lactoylglutathione lyase family enzyme
MSHILDHVGISVRDYAKSKAFYQKALAPLGIEFVMEYGDGGGFGRGGKPEFWIGQGRMAFQTDDQIRLITPSHISFIAQSRAEVDTFYRAAIEAGARDNGLPGVRAHYHPNYYGAFVLDLDGHNVEAVSHGP